MNYVATSGFPARVVFGMSILAALMGEVRADAINFLALPSQQVPTLDVRGVTISGSNTLNINAMGDAVPGLSIVGGVSGIGPGDATIDPSESITFHFDSGSATGIVLSAQYIGTLGAYTAQGESLIQAFNPAGQSLGTLDLLPSPLPNLAFNISTAFSDQPISSFRLQPAGDPVNGSFVSLGELSYTAVPEPSALLGWGLGMLIVTAHAARYRRKQTCARHGDRCR